MEIIGIFLFISNTFKPMNKEQEKELIEKLADIEHQRWSDWQKYLHSKCGKFSNGKVNWAYFSIENFRHWERQIKTDYKDLTEKEKDSDREQVMRYFPLIKKLLKQDRDKYISELESIVGKDERISENAGSLTRQWKESENRLRAKIRRRISKLIKALKQ